MMEANFCAPIDTLILAGGKGRRMRASGHNGHKLLIEVEGAPLIAHVVRIASEATTGRVYVVGERSRAAQQIASAITDEPCDFVVAASTLPATTAIAGLDATKTDEVMILSGDTLATATSLRESIRAHHRTGSSSTVVVARQPKLTDSEWTVIGPPSGPSRLEPLPQQSFFQRVAWIVKRSAVLAHQDILADLAPDGRGPSGFERGSINWTAAALERKGVVTAVTEIEATVVNVNALTDLPTASAFLASLAPSEKTSATA